MDCSSCGQTIVEFSTGKRCRACKKAYDARRCERLKLESKILIEEKMCCRCEQTKTVREFYASLHSKDGFVGACKTCTNASNKRIGEEKKTRPKIPPGLEKTCRSCKISMPIENFHKNCREKDGLRLVCKACRATYDKAARAKFEKKTPPETTFPCGKTFEPLESKIIEKVCTVCDISKMTTEFYKDVRMKGGLRSECKVCHAEYAKKRGEERENTTCTDRAVCTSCGFEKHVKWFGISHGKTKCQDCIKNPIVPDTKTCKTCRVEKSSDSFVRNTAYVDGLVGECKECFIARQDAFVRPSTKRCSGCKVDLPPDQYNANRSSLDRLQSMCKACCVKKLANRRQTCIEYKIACNTRRRMRKIIVRYNSTNAKTATKTGHTIDLFGCSVAEVVKHLESQFTDGMTWDNYGFRGWHIDHVRPCSSFDMTDPEDQKRCFHVSNLQPLWAFDNMSKGAKY